MEDTDRRWIDSMPEAYGAGLVRAVFGPFAKDLAGRAAQMGAKRLLELAAGTGVVTAEVLMLPSAEVVASDLSKAMVALGEAVRPGRALANGGRHGSTLLQRDVRPRAVPVRRHVLPR